MGPCVRACARPGGGGGGGGAGVLDEVGVLEAAVLTQVVIVVEPVARTSG
jgi:hypothetical protein